MKTKEVLRKELEQVGTRWERVCVDYWQGLWDSEFDAQENLACTAFGMSSPYEIEVGLVGGEVEDYFRVKGQSRWRFTVVVFKNEWERGEYLTKLREYERVLMQNGNENIESETGGQGCEGVDGGVYGDGEEG